MGFVADFVSGVVDSVVETVTNIVTLDIEGLVDQAVATVEGVVHTITHPTEDPIATIMLAIAAYSGYQAITSSATAEAAILAEAGKAATAAEAAAIAKGMTTAQVSAAATAASEAVVLAAGAAPAGGITASALSGPMFDAQFLGATTGMEMAAASTALAEAGVAIVSGAQFGMAGPSLSMQAGTFTGVGAGSAAGSMVGWGGGPGGITGVSTSNLFLNDLTSAWTDTDFASAEEAVPSEYAWTDEAAEWGRDFVKDIEAVPKKAQNWFDTEWKEITQEIDAFAKDPIDWVAEKLKEESARRYPLISDPTRLASLIPTSTDELIELGEDVTMAAFENWSPTITYQAGGDPGSATSESYPSFTRAETGILGDPFNLEGQDLALTVSGLASRLQQQQGLPLGQQEMGMAPTFYDPTAFRQRQAPAEELKQLMDPSYAVNQYQEPMVNEMLARLGGNAQFRGVEPSTEGISRGIAPLLSKLRQDNLSALNRAAGLDLEATRGAMGQRSGDITAQQQYQDIGIGGDVARQNITLNSLLALAQMSKPTIIGGATSRGTGTAATPGTVFSGSVPVGNILSTGWDWLTGDNSADMNALTSVYTS